MTLRAGRSTVEDVRIVRGRRQHRRGPVVLLSNVLELDFWSFLLQPQLPLGSKVLSTLIGYAWSGRQLIVRMSSSTNGPGGLMAYKWLAPALKDIPASYQSIVFNGSLDYPSIYRGPPSPQVDEAWGRISDGMLSDLTQTPKKY